MSRTLAPSPDDPTMWRKILKLFHPDAGGGHEEFIWLQSVREFVCDSFDEQGASAPTASYTSSRKSSANHDSKERIPYPVDTDFRRVTESALKYAGEHGGVYADVLWLLEDCYPIARLAHEERRGASFKRLAYVAHLAGMSKSQRIGWYGVAESIPLSDRHLGHLITRLKREAP